MKVCRSSAFEIVGHLGREGEGLKDYARIRTLVLNGANKTAAPRMCRRMSVAGGKIVPTSDHAGERIVFALAAAMRDRVDHP